MNTALSCLNASLAFNGSQNSLSKNTPYLCFASLLLFSKEECYLLVYEMVSPFFFFSYCINSNSGSVMQE